MIIIHLIFLQDCTNIAAIVKMVASLSTCYMDRMVKTDILSVLDSFVAYCLLATQFVRKLVFSCVVHGDSNFM